MKPSLTVLEKKGKGGHKKGNKSKTVYRKATRGKENPHGPKLPKDAAHYPSQSRFIYASFDIRTRQDYTAS